MSNLINNIPFNEKRTNQIQVLNEINEALDSYNHIILDAPTGFGKSVVPLTFANYYTNKDEKTSILTHTIQLQNQYIKTIKDLYSNINFEYGLIKGRNQFLCKLNNNKCDKGQCKIKIMQKPSKNNCPYNINIKDFFKECNSNTKLHICNYKESIYSSHLLSLNIINYAKLITDLMYAHQLPHTKLTFFDEAHNISNLISSNIETSININHPLIKLANYTFDDYSLNYLLNTNEKEINIPDIEYWVDELSIIYDEVKPFMEELAGAYEKYKEYNKNTNKYTKNEIQKNLEYVNQVFNKYEITVNDYEKCFGLYKKLGLLLKELQSNNVTNWCVDGKNTEYSQYITFKPIFLKKEWVEKYLLNHADKHVFMSGSFIDTDYYIRSLGMDSDDFYYVQGSSDWDWKKNNPIKYIPMGRMSQKNKDTTFPLILDLIKYLLEIHNNEKGLIHTGSWPNTEVLTNKIITNRFISYNKNSDSKAQSIEEHKKSDNSILIGPSLHEGVDLPFDDCSFQICIKIPFPYLGDAQIKARNYYDEKYVPVETVKAVTQMFGRGMRNKEDTCITYILDESFDNLLKGYNGFKGLLPQYVKEAVKHYTYNKREA